METRVFVPPPISLFKFLSRHDNELKACGVRWIGDGNVYTFWKTPSNVLKFLFASEEKSIDICRISQRPMFDEVTKIWEQGVERLERASVRGVFIENEAMFYDLIEPWLRAFQRITPRETFNIMVDEAGKFVQYEEGMISSVNSKNDQQ